ncbi:AP-1 complex subunit mu-1-like isoform X1 [Chiloscyllium plagiosum]|uniref:AP-1 complex subunit mu-1-like isoform X1 n=2 Tax=Chiloscyllium plagiosum TaxID=36176 RepID=UPI001CB7C05B|nr:AP-1 complex subunit mu-1-like isoform X1 [Chiloscyllium plagiosum]
MAFSAIYFLDNKGQVLISRNYRGNVTMSMIENFMPLLLSKEEDGSLSPILEKDDVYFLWIKYKNIYMVCTMKRNTNITLSFAFLFKVKQIFIEYFGDLEQESIQDNFILMYELLDEIMDFGYPQITETAILQEYITQEGYKLKQGAPKPPAAVTNAVSWRSEGIKYRRNELFMDVIESINFLVNARGCVVHSEILGQILINCCLSGMPEVTLCFNDNALFNQNPRENVVDFEDVKFHSCVRLSRFENERVISFIPPDKDFELMSYRVTSQVQPYLFVEANVQRYTHSRIEITAKVKGKFKERLTATDVAIIIPVPSDASSPKFSTAKGCIEWVPEDSVIIWSINSIQGGKEFMMKAHLGLPSVEAEEPEAKPPIRVKFKIQYLAASGLQIKYVRIIEKSTYQAISWIRSLTKSGDFQIRI